MITFYQKVLFKITAIYIIFNSIGISATVINFDGNLINSPCKVDQASLNQNVIFLNSSIKDYKHNSSVRPTEKFSIKLTNCDVNLFWKTVKVKFKGQTEPEMGEEQKYFLSLLNSDNKGKLAIGFIDIDENKRVALGEYHNGGKGTELSDGTVLLTFKAFVKATPAAISTKSVVAGMYNATVEFQITYE